MSRQPDNPKGTGGQGSKNQRAKDQGSKGQHAKGQGTKNRRASREGTKGQGTGPGGTTGKNAGTGNSLGSLWVRLWHSLYKALLHIKYLPFAGERPRQPRQQKRGFVVIQIDALAHDDLREMVDQGQLPYLGKLIREQGWELRRFAAGLPSATPAVQAAIMYGTKGAIPAFRFYEKDTRSVLTGSHLPSVQIMRDRLGGEGVLKGGSSYANVYDGGASRAAFTLSGEPQTLLKRLGGGRLLLLLLLHPIRLLRMPLASFWEYILEERDRLMAHLRGRYTQYWWYFPFLRIGASVLLRELQTLVVLLDIYTGSPAIYTTYLTYDEFGHGFGPRARPTIKNLRSLDRHVREIHRMIKILPGRPYDLYILSDHGQTPAVPYRIRYGETLGDTITHAVDLGVHIMAGTGSYAPPKETPEFLVREMEDVATASLPPTRQLGLRLLRWLRRHYQLFPLVAEHVRIEPEHNFVVTYSSSLAHLYWTDPTHPLSFAEIRGNADYRAIYYFLVAHRGIGLVITRMLDGAHVESPDGRALVQTSGETVVLSGEDPLDTYLAGSYERQALVRLVQLPNAGDLVLFSVYDKDSDLCISFDDQLGAHGAFGGRQFWPFLLTEPGTLASHHVVSDPLDLYPILKRYGNE